MFGNSNRSCPFPSFFQTGEHAKKQLLFRVNGEGNFIALASKVEKPKANVH